MRSSTDWKVPVNSAKLALFLDLPQFQLLKNNDISLASLILAQFSVTD